MRVHNRKSLLYSSIHEKPSCQASGTLRLFRATWPIWNNRKALNIKQSSIFMWRFCWSSRRSFQPRSQGFSLLRSRERTLGTRLGSFWHSLLIIGRRWNSRNSLRNSGGGSSRRNSGGGSLGRNSRRNWRGWRIWNTWRRLGYRKDKTGPRPGYTYEPRDRAVCNGDTSLNTHNFVVKLMPCGQTNGRRLITKTFLAFPRTFKRRHWSKLPPKKFSFPFLSLLREKLRFPAKTFLALQRFSAIIYHIRSN